MGGADICGWCGFGLEERDHLPCASEAADLRRYVRELEARCDQRDLAMAELGKASENARQLGRAREDILRAEIERLTERQHALELDLARCHEDCDEARDIARRAKKCCNDSAWRWLVLDGRPDPAWVAGG